MAFLIRIRSWRTRRKERKTEELLALAAPSPEDTADAESVQGTERVQKRVRDDWWKGHLVELSGDRGGHAGEEGQPTKY